MDQSYIQKISEIFDELPRSKDNFFKQLWHDNRIKFDGTAKLTDEIDLRSAQLTCASLSGRKNLLLVLPDHARWRMPLLFATGLIMHTLDNKGQNQNRKIAYFGKGASIKSHLAKTQILKISLENIYDQINIGNTFQPSSIEESTLPQVLFSYSPTNVEQVFENYFPDWVFIDCGDGTNPAWIYPLIEQLIKRGIQGIACVQNPLSDVIDLFKKHEWNIFSWNSSYSNKFQTKISTIVIECEYGFKQAESLQKASTLLTECRKLAISSFEKDALQAVGRYIHCIETLSVPLNFWESESKNYWGIYALSVHRQLVERYVSSLSSGNFKELLNKILSEIIPRHEELFDNQPPMWLALQQLCIDPSATPSILIFQNRAQQQLFSLAMLAENNIAENELQEYGVYLSHIKEFAQWEILMGDKELNDKDHASVPKGLTEVYPKWHPILVGVPYKGKSAFYTHLLKFENISVLLSPNQILLANWHFNRWNDLYNQIHSKNISCLESLNPSSKLNHLLDIQNPVTRVITSNQKSLLLDKNQEKLKHRMSDFIKLSPRTEELAYLLGEFTSSEEDIRFNDEEGIATSETQLERTSEVIEEVFVVQFQANFEVMFAKDDKIKMIKSTPSGKTLEEQYIRSLRPFDQVLLINGLKRQSLYDLIISRIHDHPTFVLHLSLIERWHHEFYMNMLNSKKSFYALLHELQLKGSKIKSELAVRQWNSGLIICPQDYEDLKRLSEILNMPFVKQYHSQIYKAAQRLRGIHRVLSRKLNAWLREEAFLSNSQSFKDIIDEELNLDFRDFQDSLLILTVERIEEKKGLFLPSDLGQLKQIN